METPENKRFVYEFGKFMLDPREKTLFTDGAPLHLPAKEFETLLLLVENNNRALSKEEMMRAIWRDAFVEETNLVKQISRLRKIFNTNGQQYIETLPKHGYRFSADVNQVFQPAGETILEQRTVKRLTVKLEENSEASPLLSPAARQKFRFPAIFAAALIFLAVAAVVVIWYWNRSNAPAKINSMAVLPLRPLTEGENNKALGLGLADALIMKIGGLRQITVRPISAVAPFADAPPPQSPEEDALEIGKKLKVDAVLEGTIQRFEGRVRFNVRLLRVENGEQIWAEQFESDAARIFDLQDRLAAQTARALKLKLGASENEHLAKHFTNDAEALDAFLKGRYFTGRRTAGDLKTAINYFNEAIAKDPNYALAHAGLADAYSLLADYDGALPADAYPKAKDAAMKALELDDELAEAHTSLAYVKMYFYHDWRGAEAGYHRAIALNPNYATARHWYSEYLTATGRFDEALVEMRRAKEIDPLSPSVNAQEVWILFYERRFDEAIERGREIARLNPDFAEVYDPLKRCYDRKGMYAEAIAARQTRRRLAGWNATETAALKAAAATSESGVYWKKRLEQEIVEARDELPMPFEMAIIYAQLGENDSAFKWLDEAIEIRAYSVSYLRVEPNLDPLRSDARFAEALRRVNLLF
jgi:DNA-binding winged helix-turn-helix (wHTH) protein/TolB-like protein